jgi:hypothetical protein
MNKDNESKFENDDLDLKLIYPFIQACYRNIVKLTLACILIGGAYYFTLPKVYEASVSIEMAKVASEPVEDLKSAIEKMKLPLYFSTATYMLCGLDEGFHSGVKFTDKVKVNVNNVVALVSFSHQAKNATEAKACMNALIAELQAKQGELAEHLIKKKNKRLLNLREELKLIEEDQRTLTDAKRYYIKNTTIQLQSFYFNKKDLKLQILALEEDLVAPKTHPLLIVSSVYTREVNNNKRAPTQILGSMLVLGVFLGIMITGISLVAPVVKRQIKEYLKL